MRTWGSSRSASWGLYVAAVLTVFVGFACATAPSGSHAASRLPRNEEGGLPPATLDAGAMNVCTHDAKDLAPCADDCDRGLAFGCTVVAQRVERGDGVPRDLTRVVRLHERACELRDIASCVSAARMHASGAGVPPSRGKQLELLGSACALGDGAACATAARAFADGAGARRDEARARDLWERACAGGVASACEEIEQAP